MESEREIQKVVEDAAAVEAVGAPLPAVAIELRPSPRRRSTTRARKEYGKEAHRIEESCTYASKGHYNEAERLRRMHFWVGLASATLSAAAGATGLLAGSPVLAALIAFLSAATMAVLTFQKPAEKSNLHQAAGAAYGDLQTRARQFRRVRVHENGQENELAELLETLTNEKARLDKNAPGASPSSYKLAQAGIQDGEAAHEVDRKDRT